MNKAKKNNVVNFPSNLTEGEREVEAILFAAAEPLDVDSIESKITKKINVLKVLEKLKQTYANRGIIKDRSKDYEGALADYLKALGIDHEAVAGPGLGTIILNYKFKSSSVQERALYLNEQLQLPKEERILSIKELDEGQVMHKPGKL